MSRFRAWSSLPISLLELDLLSYLPDVMVLSWTPGFPEPGRTENPGIFWVCGLVTAGSRRTPDEDTGHPGRLDAGFCATKYQLGPIDRSIRRRK